MSGYRYSLIVKGPRAKALHTANRRLYRSGVEFSGVSESDGSTVIYVTAPTDLTGKLNEWFIAPPRNPPYPAGALLHWGTRSAEVRDAVNSYGKDRRRKQSAGSARVRVHVPAHTRAAPKKGR